MLLDFARAFPEIQIDVNFSDRVMNLVDEGFDLAVRIGKPADSSLIARKLCDARIIVVAAPDYLARKGEPQRPDDLTEHDCVIDTNFRDPLGWRFATANPGGSITVTVSGRLRFSNGEACLAAAEAGFGIARMPSFIAGARIREGHVQPLLSHVEAAPLGIYAVYPPGKHLALKVRTLVDFLANCFRGKPEWDRG